MGAVIDHNVRDRLLSSVLWIGLLGCVGGAWLGGKARRRSAELGLSHARFWQRGVPVTELTALPVAARRAALAELSQDLRSAGGDGPLNAALRSCLHPDTAPRAACQRADDLARSRAARQKERRKVLGQAQRVVALGAPAVALVLGVLLFRLAGRAGRLAVVLCLMLACAAAAFRVKSTHASDAALDGAAHMDRFVLTLQIGLKGPLKNASRWAPQLRRQLRALPGAERPAALALDRGLAACAHRATRVTACPRTLPLVARHREAALNTLRPSRSQARFAGWLETSATLLCLLIPLLGAIDRRKEA